MISCFDTQILIWGVQGFSKSTQQHMVATARQFIKRLEREGDAIVIPAPAVAEYLIRVPKENRIQTADYLRRHFRVVPFDSAASGRFAEIWEKRYGAVNWDAEDKPKKSEMKFDIQIISIALSIKADRIFSEDKNLRKIAEGLINVEGLPNVPVQLTFNV